jgi:hypothetical protein
LRPGPESGNLVAKSGVVTVRATVGRGLRGAFSSESAKARSARRRPQTGRASCDLRGSLLDRRAGEPRNDRRFCRRQLRLRNGTPLSIRLAPIARYLASSLDSNCAAGSDSRLAGSGLGSATAAAATLPLHLPQRPFCASLPVGPGLGTAESRWARPMRTAQLRQHLVGRPPLPGGHPAHGAPPLTRRTALIPLAEECPAVPGRTNSYPGMPVVQNPTGSRRAEKTGHGGPPHPPIFTPSFCLVAFGIFLGFRLLVPFREVEAKSLTGSAHCPGLARPLLASGGIILL